MPESTPCQFNKGTWAKMCGKPSDNGWCTEHEKILCVSCGQQATHGCEAQMGGLMCGAPICASCHHDQEGGHITKECWEEKRKQKAEVEARRKAAEKSTEVLMNKELGVPETLFELTKTNPGELGFQLSHIYYLELTHGLMGFFPAIFTNDRGIIFTTSLALLGKVWRQLPARQATINKRVAYVNTEIMIAYVYSEDDWRQKKLEPFKLLSEKEYESLPAEEENFCWAPGLIGGKQIGQEDFLNDLVSQAKKLDPKFISSF